MKFAWSKTHTPDGHIELGYSWQNANEKMKQWCKKRGKNYEDCLKPKRLKYPWNWIQKRYHDPDFWIWYFHHNPLKPKSKGAEELTDQIYLNTLKRQGNIPLPKAKSHNYRVKNRAVHLNIP